MSYTAREISSPDSFDLSFLRDIPAVDVPLRALHNERLLHSIHQLPFPQHQFPPAPQLPPLALLPIPTTIAPPVLPVATLVDTPPVTFDTLYDSARSEEQRAHFTALANSLHSRMSAHGITSLAETTASIITDTITTEKLNRHYRLICRLGALDPSCPQETLFQKAETAPLLDRPLAEVCSFLGITLHPASHRLIAAFTEQEVINDTLENPEVLVKEKASLGAALASLEQLLSPPPDETEALEDRNRAILLTLRSIYSSPLYNSLCMSDLPLVDILGTIAVGQYANTTLAPTFDHLGRQLQGKDRQLPERINSVWEQLAEKGIDNGIFTTLLHYTFRLLFKIGLPYIALKIAQLFSLNWLIPYIGDERSILGNTPGALTDEIQAKDPFFSRTIRTVVLPAPTLGHQIASEFRAALQALENNQFSTDPNPYLTWAYTNLQNISFTPESPSTISLMELNTFYPLSFQAITLPQNLPDSPASTFSHDEVGHHLALLFQPRTTSLENRGTDSDPGYYLSPHFLHTYRPSIEALANDAYLIIDTHRSSHTPAALKTAFTRLFHLGLLRLHETASFNLTAARTHRTALSAIRSTICASCVDRGGMMNAAQTYSLSTDGQLNDLATGAYFGRAILSHRRSPTKQSAEALSTLFAVAPEDAVREFLTKITPEFHSSLRPAT